MIIDTLDNCGLYTREHPLFEKAFRCIHDTDLLSLPAGIYPVDGDDIFVNVIESALRSPADAAVEVHDRYIDIQVLLEGEETYGWALRAQCRSPRGVMDTENDILFFDDPCAFTFPMKPGGFCVFFPTDGHAPLIGNPDKTVKKYIVKVRV